MKKSIILLALLIVLSAQYSMAGELNFRAEADRVAQALHCGKPHITPGDGDVFGDLYSCISGKAQTVKFFINEYPNTNKVKNIKLMWNDYSRDVGYGVHADEETATIFLKRLCSLYAKELESQLIEIFFSESDTNIESDKYIFKYTYYRGPSIDERLITITVK